MKKVRGKSRENYRRTNAWHGEYEECGPEYGRRGERKRENDRKTLKKTYFVIHMCSLT